MHRLRELRGEVSDGGVGRVQHGDGQSPRPYTSTSPRAFLPPTPSMQPNAATSSRGKNAASAPRSARRARSTTSRKSRYIERRGRERSSLRRAMSCSTPEKSRNTGTGGCQTSLRPWSSSGFFPRAVRPTAMSTGLRTLPLKATFARAGKGRPEGLSRDRKIREDLRDDVLTSSSESMMPASLRATITISGPSSSSVYLPLKEKLEKTPGKSRVDGNGSPARIHPVRRLPRQAVQQVLLGLLLHALDQGGASSPANTTRTREVYIFGMDIRAVGKDFEEYRNRGANESGIKFVRSRVAEVLPKTPTTTRFSGMRTPSRAKSTAWRLTWSSWRPPANPARRP